MIQVSDAYKELVKSNVRPKAEPIIKVSGKDNNGNDIELVWRAKNIKDLKYKRGIDPVGRELPYMELTWTEIYTGRLNAESYPEKYNNITKYMAVELSFVQDLGFHNTWKTIFDGGITWKSLFSQKATWKQLKNSVSQETIVLPKMFLSARPTINGQTITWVAKDLLGFANENQIMQFTGSSETPLNLKNILSYFILNSRGAFLKTNDLFNSYTETVESLKNDDTFNVTLDKRIICDGKTNSIILNLASIFNYYIDFHENIAVFKKFNPTKVDFSFNKKTIFKHPSIEQSTNISSYNFKYRIAELDQNNAYYKSPSNVIDYGNGNCHSFYVLNGYGEAYASEESTKLLNAGQINTVDWLRKTTNPNEKVYVVPIRYNPYDNIIDIDNIGEVFSEDNPINPYNKDEEEMILRKDFLNAYFSNSSSSISFETLANLSLETNDIIEVSTNLYDENGNEVVKKAIIVKIELFYNGSLKQNIKAHEVSL